MLGFVGPFGDSNYGDYAMFVNNIKTMNLHEFAVFSYNDYLLDTIRNTYLQDCTIHSCKVQVGYHYEESYTKSYHIEYDLRPYTPVEIISLISNVDEIKNLLQNIDILVVCGGGYFNHIWNANHRKARLFSILGTILLANQMRKKIYFMGQTFGPFKESRDVFFAFFNLLKNVVYAARDNVYSESEMKKIGVCASINTIPDDLYFLDNSLVDKRAPIIDGQYIVWEFYPSMDEIENHIYEAHKFVNHMSNAYGYKVVFMPLDVGYGGTMQGQLLHEKIPQIEFESEGGQILKIEDMNNIVKNAKFVVCQRYHLFLTAITHRIPVIQILKEIQGDYQYYYCKAKGLLEQVFSNQCYNDSTFLRLNIWDTLQDIELNFNTICMEQRALFNSDIYCAEMEMRLRRETYLQKILS